MIVTRPFADSRLAAYLEKRILELRPTKTQGRIAAEAGFVNPNMLTMLKTGSNRLPLDRVTALAAALEADPAHLMQLALAQSVGDTDAAALMAVFGTPVTSNEESWLAAIREASGNSNPPLSKRARAALFAIFGR